MNSVFAARAISKQLNTLTYGHFNAEHVMQYKNSEMLNVSILTCRK